MDERLEGVDEKLIHHYLKGYVKEDELVRCIQRNQLSYEQARLLVRIKRESEVK